MAKSNDNNHMTDADLKEIGISRQQWNVWLKIMTRIHSEYSKRFPGEVNSVNNEVKVNGWTLGVFLVNNSFFQIVAKKGTVEMLNMRYTNNLSVVLRILREITK